MTDRVDHGLVLTAGLGTRLRPLTLVRAKPAIPLAGEPIVERIIRRLAVQGVTNLVLNLHHRPETITTVVGDGSHLGAQVRYSWEQPAVLGSAGGPKLAAPILGAHTFLIVNGDTLTDVDLATLVATHTRSGALVTMALLPNNDPERYGGVCLDREGRVTGFAKRGMAAVGTFHFIGVQVAAAAAFDAIAPGAIANSVGHVYDELLRRRPGAIRGFVCAANFWDIGTVADYWRTSLAFAAEQTSGSPHRSDAPGVSGEERVTLSCGHDVRIDPTAVVRRSILWDRVTIGPGAVVDGCILTDDVEVESGAQHHNSILSRAEDGRVFVSARPSI